MKGELHTYDTRVDCFRVKEKLDHIEWASRAGMSRTQLHRARKGVDMTLHTLLRLTAAASELLHRPVSPSELADLGEDEPVATEKRAFHSSSSSRAVFDTPLDKALYRDEIPPLAMAVESGVSRQRLLCLRSRPSAVRVSKVAQLVRAFRRMGRNVRASDLFDLSGAWQLWEQEWKV